VSIEADLLGAFEEHSPAGIRELLAAGVSPTQPINGTQPIDALIGMYAIRRMFTGPARRRRQHRRSAASGGSSG
jgi:hypothetical protein